MVLYQNRRSLRMPNYKHWTNRICKKWWFTIFIPQQGCPHQCVFCNQLKITGKERIPDARDVAETIELYLSTWKGSGKREVAFYGGSFTGLDRSAQE